MSGANAFFEGFVKGFKYFGSLFSTIINTILLSIVYLVGVGLTSAFAKIAGKHFLESKPNKKQKTYWQNLGLKEEKMGNGHSNIDRYYRQF